MTSRLRPASLARPARRSSRGQVSDDEGGEPRRRRRRGGRGRGRGRGRAEEGARGPGGCRGARGGRSTESAQPDAAAAGAPDPRRGRGRPADAPRAAQHAVRVRLGLAARDAGRTGGRVAGAVARRRGLRRAGDPRVPDRRAASRWQPRRWRRPRRAARWPVGLPVGHGSGALRSWRRGRDQPLPGRQRPDARARAASRRPELQPRRSNAATAANVERAVERRAARARGDAPCAGGAEAASATRDLVEGTRVG